MAVLNLNQMLKKAKKKIILENKQKIIPEFFKPWQQESVLFNVKRSDNVLDNLDNKPDNVLDDNLNELDNVLDNLDNKSDNVLDNKTNNLDNKSDNVLDNK